MGSLGVVIQCRVLHDGLSGCRHYLVSGAGHGRSLCCVIHKISRVDNCRIGSNRCSRCGSGRSFGCRLGQSIDQLIRSFLHTLQCQTWPLCTGSHQATKQCTSTNLLTYTIAQGLGLVSMALDRRVACHLAHTTLTTFFQELGADVGQRRLQAGRGHGSSFKACHQLAHSNCSRGCNHGGFQACLVGQSSAGFLWGQPLLHQLGELRRLHGQVCELHAQHIIGCLLERTTGFHRTNESSNTALICGGSHEAGLVFSKDACGTASSEHLGISGSSYSGERADPN